MSALLDANLLVREMPPRGGEPRLRMLETVRELALEEFARDPEAAPFVVAIATGIGSSRNRSRRR